MLVWASPSRVMASLGTERIVLAGVRVLQLARVHHAENRKRQLRADTAHFEKGPKRRPVFRVRKAEKRDGVFPNVRVDVKGDRLHAVGLDPASRPWRQKHLVSDPLNVDDDGAIGVPMHDGPGNSPDHPPTVAAY